MDICLIGTKEGTQILPVTIHGMLWLQTHFEEEYWNALAQNQAKVTLANVKILAEDAIEAGLKVNQMTEPQVANSL